MKFHTFMKNLSNHETHIIFWKWQDGVSEQEDQKNKYKTYYSRNKQLHAWLGGDLHTWFVDYLNRYRYGASVKDKFRLFPYEP